MEPDDLKIDAINGFQVLLRSITGYVVSFEIAALILVISSLVIQRL